MHTVNLRDKHVKAADLKLVGKLGAAVGAAKRGGRGSRGGRGGRGRGMPTTPEDSEHFPGGPEPEDGSPPDPAAGGRGSRGGRGGRGSGRGRRVAGPDGEGLDGGEPHNKDSLIT